MYRGRRCSSDFKKLTGDIRIRRAIDTVSQLLASSNRADEFSELCRIKSSTQSQDLSHLSTGIINAAKFTCLVNLVERIE